MRHREANAAEALVSAALRGKLTEGRARQLCTSDPEVVVFALLAASKRIAELQIRSSTSPTSPSAPSGMVPVYEKPNRAKRPKRPGAKKDHRGTRRAKPTRIDGRRVHRLERCPDCGGPLKKCRNTRTRIIEDIPEDIQPVITEHTLHRDFCPKCRKHVEPVIPDAMPHATLGHHVVSLTSWFHYGLGVTVAQIVDILGYHLQTRSTPGAWRRACAVRAIICGRFWINPKCPSRTTSPSG